MKKFKRFLVISTILLGVSLFSLLSTLNAYSNDMPQYEYISVKEGDTVWSIASQYMSNADIRDFVKIIEQENNIKNSELHPGEIIRVSKR